MNTRVLPLDFNYLEPKSVEEALVLLSEYRGRAKVIAGGTDLLVRMKLGEITPEYLISLGRISGLRFLSLGKGLALGPLTSFRDLEGSRVVQEKYTALAEAAQFVSSVQIKIMGTIGGNLCHGSPAADSAPPLIAFGAKVKLAAKGAERFCPLEEFFLGPRKTVLSPNELLVGIEIPPGKSKGSAFLKIARVPTDLAKVNVAVVMERDGEFCGDCRIVLGSVGPTPLRAREAENILIGKKFGEALVETASAKVSEATRPITDVRSEEGYRREVSKVITRDALRLAWKRAEGGRSH